MAPQVYAEETLTGALELLEAVAPEDIHFAGGNEIRAHIEAIRIEGVVAGAEKVIEEGCSPRSIWKRDLAEQSFGLRRQAICWYHVACELSSVRRCDVASCRKARYFVRTRIVDVLTQIAKVGSAPSGDISSFEGGRYTVRRCAANMAALTLVIAKNEELVLPNGSAKRTSELIPVAAGNTALLIKWITGKIGIGALKFEPRSVNLVGSRFGLRRDNRTDGLAKFRVIILMNNLSFLDRIEIRIDNDDPQNRILVIRAV